MEDQMKCAGQAALGSRQDLAERARREVGAAVQRIVRDTGGRFVARPMFSGEPDGPATRDAEPLAGPRAVPAAALAAPALAPRYVRPAPRDRHTLGGLRTP